MHIFERNISMKRTILAILVLAVALLIVGSGRSRLARIVHITGAPIVHATVVSDDPQTDGDEVSEEFHQTYPLNATGRVSIANINGSVRIAAWDQNEVKVDAVKRASSKEALDELKIEVNNTADSVRIKTEYPDSNWSRGDRENRRHRSASVEYTFTVPRRARLDSVELVNGSLDIEGVEGDVEAACVNGSVKARGLTGEVKLSTVNGGVEATIMRLDEAKPTSLSSVNGSISLTIPANANAQVKASTIHGRITNDFGLQVNDGEFVGHDLNGQIGTGGTRIRLNNVNGSIAIKRG
ncbi:MAG: hypothetical protein QOK48_2182 [Blastocatellia bacterium]|nr:hypothetical protein [Blastocatellia bacterium]